MVRCRCSPHAARRNRLALASGRLTLVRGDFADYPSRTRIANAVLAVNVAYFMQGADAIGEARRVLCPSGRLVLYATEARRCAIGLSPILIPTPCSIVMSSPL